MKIAELRAKGDDELKEVILMSKKELFNLRMQAATGELSGTARSKVAKKTIARAKTLLKEKASGGKSVAPKKTATKAAKAPAAKKVVKKEKKG